MGESPLKIFLNVIHAIHRVSDYCVSMQMFLWKKKWWQIEHWATHNRCCWRRCFVLPFDGDETWGNLVCWMCLRNVQHREDHFSHSKLSRPLRGSFFPHLGYALVMLNLLQMEMSQIDISSSGKISQGLQHTGPVWTHWRADECLPIVELPCILWLTH